MCNSIMKKPCRQFSWEYVAWQLFCQLECLLGQAPYAEEISLSNLFLWALSVFRTNIGMLRQQCHILFLPVFLALVDAPRLILVHISTEIILLFRIFNRNYLLPQTLCWRFLSFFGIFPVAHEYKLDLERRLLHPIGYQWRHFDS